MWGTCDIDKKVERPDNSGLYPMTVCDGEEQDGGEGTENGTVISLRLGRGSFCITVKVRMT